MKNFSHIHIHIRYKLHYYYACLKYVFFYSFLGYITNNKYDLKIIKRRRECCC